MKIETGDLSLQRKESSIIEQLFQRRVEKNNYIYLSKNWDTVRYYEKAEESAEEDP